MTFAATAEIVRYLGAHPVLVDCDPITLNMDLDDAATKLAAAAPRDARRAHPGGSARGRHHSRARRRADARRRARARASPPSTDSGSSRTRRTPFRRRGGPPRTLPGSAAASGPRRSAASRSMRTRRSRPAKAAWRRPTTPSSPARMRLMSLHGLSHDAWGRYSGGGKWDYRILAPGLQVQPDRRRRRDRHPPARAAPRRCGGSARRSRSAFYEALSEVEEIELPPTDSNRIHSWHLFPDPPATREPCDRPQRVLGRAQGVGRGLLGPLAAAAPASLLHGDLRLEERRAAGRDARLGAARSACRSFPAMREDEIVHVVDTRPVAVPPAARRPTGSRPVLSRRARGGRSPAAGRGRARGRGPPRHGAIAPALGGERSC